jgi:hypothetical protein
MARSLYETLTTPPPRKPPPPKYPLFTKDPFSTTSWGPGQLVGLGVFVIGGIGVWKWAQRKKVEAEQARQLAGIAPATPTGSPAKGPQEPKLAQVENQRGQYGPTGGSR